MIKEGRGKAEVAGTSPNDAIDPMYGPRRAAHTRGRPRYRARQLGLRLGQPVLHLHGAQHRDGAADSSSRQIRGRLRAGPAISGQHAGATYACLSLVIVVSGTPAK